MGMIENISILLIVYTDIFMHGYGYILGHSDHSAFTVQGLLAGFAWLFLGPLLSPISGPVQGPAHVLYYVASGPMPLRSFSYLSGAAVASISQIYCPASTSSRNSKSLINTDFIIKVSIVFFDR